MVLQSQGKWWAWQKQSKQAGFGIVPSSRPYILGTPGTWSTSTYWKSQQKMDGNMGILYPTQRTSRKKWWGKYVALKMWKHAGHFIKMQQNLINFYWLTIYSNPPCAHILLSWNNIITFKVNKHIFKIQVNSYMPQKLNTTAVHHFINTCWTGKVN